MPTLSRTKSTSQAETKTDSQVKAKGRNKTKKLPEIDYSINSARYNQLEIYDYILKARTPTLQELCDIIPEIPVLKKKTTTTRRKHIPDEERRYPKNWAEISRSAKERQGYRCQVCNCQCLRPGDDKSKLTLSEIAQKTANTHHIDGNGFNNDPSNLYVVCSTHHLAIHRGQKVMLEQLKLFDTKQFSYSIKTIKSDRTK